MHTNAASMEKEKWVRITKRQDCIEGENPLDVKSPHTKYWLKATYTCAHITSYGNSYPMYRYELHDPELNPIEIQTGNIAVTSIWDTSVHAFGYGIECTLRDKVGQTGTRPFGGGSFDAAMKSVFKFLESHQKCGSLHELELSEANSKLSAENSSLKERIERLKEDVASLKLLIESEKEARNGNPSE